METYTISRMPQSLARKQTIIRILYTSGAAIIIATISSLLILYGKGYSIKPVRNGDVILAKTGWIVLKSTPDGAKSYLNDKLENPTNSSIGNLKPGDYNLRIVKDGYHEWKKKITVKEELVTIADAFLIKKAPDIRPVTLTGVTSPVADSTKNLVIYYGSSDEVNGLWLYSQGDSIIASARANPRIVAIGDIFKNVKKIEWSPDSSQILVQVQATPTSPLLSYIFDVNKTYSAPFSAISNPEKFLNSWKSETQIERDKLIAQLNVPTELVQLAKAPETLFSLDQKKFIYAENQDSKIIYHVVDLTVPLPVGKEMNRIFLEVDKNEPLKVAWHSSNEHILIHDSDLVKIIEDDGGNQTTIINVEIRDNLVLPAPDGRSVIINTSFNKGSSSNLHRISFN